MAKIIIASCLNSCRTFAVDTTFLFFTVCTPIRLTSDLILHDIHLSRIAGLKLQTIVPIDFTNFSSKLHCVNFE